MCVFVCVCVQTVLVWESELYLCLFLTKPKIGRIIISGHSQCYLRENMKRGREKRGKWEKGRERKDKREFKLKTKE